MGGANQDNFADDFFDAIGTANDPENLREIPALHPAARSAFPPGKWRNVAKEEEGRTAPGAENQLFEQPKGKFKARFGRFDLNDDTQRAELEEIENSCLTPGKNWILAREEWYNTKDGDTYVVVKYLEFIPEKKTKKPPEAKEDRGPEQS
jgi:hypothetical protein